MLYNEISSDASPDYNNPFLAYAQWAKQNTKSYDDMTLEELLDEDPQLPELAELRLQVRRNGYHPVPVLGPHAADKARGKRPTMLKWQEKCLGASYVEVVRWLSTQRNCT